MTETGSMNAIPREFGPIGRHWAGLIVLSLVVAAFTSVVALAAQRPWLDEAPSASLGGREVKGSDADTGPLQITSIRSSAFSTTVELSLALSSNLEADDTVAVERAAIRVDPQVVDLHLSGVRRTSASQVTLLLTGGPLPPAAAKLVVAIDAYVVVHADRGERVTGPLLAASTIRGSVPDARELPASVFPLVTDLGDGLQFVIDDASFDGYLLRVGYHVDGDTAAVQMFGAAPPLTGDAVPLPLLGAASSDRREVDVRVPTNTESLQLLLPRLVRSKTDTVSATLRRSSATEFAGTATIAGISVTFRTELEGRDAFSVRVQSAPGTPLAFTASVSDVRLADVAGTPYLHQRVAGKAADSSGANSTLTFAGAVPPSIDELQLSFRGFELAGAEPPPVTLQLK
jgi:hypothetical protein